MNETTETTIITSIINFVLNAISITKAVKVSPFKDSPDSKTVNLKINFNNISLQSVVDSAIRSDIIRWQASARNAYDSLIDGSTVERNFSAPVRTVTITPEMAEQAFMAKLANMTPEKRLAYLSDKLIEEQARIDEEQAKIDAEEADLVDADPESDIDV